MSEDFPKDGILDAHRPGHVPYQLASKKYLFQGILQAAQSQVTEFQELKWHNTSVAIFFPRANHPAKFHQPTNSIFLPACRIDDEANNTNSSKKFETNFSSGLVKFACTVQGERYQRNLLLVPPLLFSTFFFEPMPCAP